MTSGFVRAADVDKSDINVAPPRNIVYILSDDLGYGDLGCYGATKVKTPNLDRLAAEGIRFTDAYAPSSVCSPSRYAILTGRFFWRTTNDCEVLANDAPFHAGLDRTTVPSLLKSAGYKTGGVGKWHLGIGTAEHTDWNAPLKPGPLEAGFDYFFGMPSNLLLVPPVYIENHGIANQDPNTKIVITGKGKNAVATGITDVRRDIEAAPRFAAKAIEFIEKSKDTPFFLYFATNIVHDPIVPAPQFQGTSQAGPYGDFIQQLDFEVGQLLDTLDRLGLSKDTLVIFTSDNGGVVPPPGASTQLDQAKAIKMGLAINGVLRGGKHSDFEGGFRIPFIARWPGRIPAGVVSPAIINTTDLLATMSALVHKPIPAPDGEDSFNILPVLLNKTTVTKGRDYTAMLSARGNFAVRSDDWKYIEKRIDANFSPNILKTHNAIENAFQL
jgi:arylsulfatase A-like enzyme